MAHGLFNDALSTEMIRDITVNAELGRTRDKRIVSCFKIPSGIFL